MKKFSEIDKVNLFDNQVKTYNETISALFDELISVKYVGENSELASTIQTVIDGKEKFIAVIESINTAHVLKERVKILEQFKVKAFKNGTLNFVDDEIDMIKESLEKLANGDKNISVDIEISNDIISENKNSGETE